jgi:hypothetical protein
VKRRQDESQRRDLDIPTEAGEREKLGTTWWVSVLIETGYSRKQKELQANRDTDICL